MAMRYHRRGINRYCLFAALACKALRDPELDYRLAGNTKTPSFLIERLNHPDRKIYVYPLDFKARTPRSASVKMPRHVGPKVVQGIQFFSVQFPFSGHSIVPFRFPELVAQKLF